MGDANPIYTLRDYSRPSHDGYRNTIELPEGNNVIAIDYAACERLRKLRPEVASKTIEYLAQYEEEGWNEPVILEEESLDYENPDLKQLLRVIECKVGTLMEKAISLMGRSESVFGMLSNMMRQLPLEPSRQEAFGDLVMNFILNQEERFNPPLVRESVFGFKPGRNDNQNIKSRYDAKNSNPQCTPQVLPSFEENSPHVTYPNEVEEIIGIPIEVDPLEETPLEDLGLNTCNHDITLSSREIPNFDEPEPQPQPLSSCPPLDISPGEERGPEPPIKPPNLDSFRKKEVDHLTNHTPPSPHVASFHPKDT
nr:ribonuclease H-like domain-containing protein [Tanacetum cinerariifolium]